MNFRLTPRHAMPAIRIHPPGGNVCQGVVFRGSPAMRAEYLFTALRNMRQKHISTKAVMSSSHQSLSVGIVKYAWMPLTAMTTPGAPQRRAAM